MSPRKKLRGLMLDIFGKAAMWLWMKSTRMTVDGEEKYWKLRETGKPVILLVWHRKIFLVPYFFRRRGIMPLISLSRDGEIAARIMDDWGYKILRGSGSHMIKSAWLEMKKELLAGGAVLIVPDGPRGPDRNLKLGCIKLATETGAVLLPWSFTAYRKKILKSWDRFLMFYPFTKVAAVYGRPIEVSRGLSVEAMEIERRRIEKIMVAFDAEIDRYFE